MASPPARTASRQTRGGARTTTKPEASGPVLPVTNPLDLWYLCEKARFAKANPYRRARDQRPMYQRTVTHLVRADNELFHYRFPYCAEVGFDMTHTPPRPLMSTREPFRPSRFPLSQYKRISNRQLPDYSSVEVETDLLTTHELEQSIALPLSGDPERGIWLDVEGETRGLLRIPDVLRLKSFTERGEGQYSQPNLASVIEMKFPGDAFTREQQLAYIFIAGSDQNLRLLRTERCESSDGRQRRGWMQAAKKEPVYMPVGQAMSLPLRASADPHALLVGLIDAEHQAARRALEVKPPPPGTPMMSASPSSAAINRRAVAQMEMVLAAPFVATGGIAMAIGGSTAAGAAAATDTALTAQAGARIIQFKRTLSATGAAGAAMAASRLAAQPNERQAPALSEEEQRRQQRYLDWEASQRHKQIIEQHYLFWPDAPETRK